MTEPHYQLPDTINPNNFPAKLWRMVNNPANRAIYWDISGEVIVINQSLFEQLVLSPGGTKNEDYSDTFKTTHFSSFVRQLNLYGFKKADSASSSLHFVNKFITSPERSIIHFFYNPNFRRNNPELLVNLKRLTVDNKAKIDCGIEVKCRPPTKNQGIGNRDDIMEKHLMKGGFSPVIRGRKDSPHPYRKLPMAPWSGTPAPPHHLSSFQQGDRCGVNYGTPNFTGIHERNQQYHPGFYSPIIQCYPPALMAMRQGMQTGPFMPIGYFPPCCPMRDLGSNDLRPGSVNQNKEAIKKADINLDTVFQIADEVMLAQPNNSLVKIEVQEKASTSDDHTVVSDSKPCLTPKEPLTEDTKEDLVQIKVEQVEVSNTSDSKSCQG